LSQSLTGEVLHKWASWGAVLGSFCALYVYTGCVQEVLGEEGEIPFVLTCTLQCLYKVYSYT
jgi:hypothetical protein